MIRNTVSNGLHCKRNLKAFPKYELVRNPFQYIRWYKKKIHT